MIHGFACHADRTHNFGSPFTSYFVRHLWPSPSSTTNSAGYLARSRLMQDLQCLQTVSALSIRLTTTFFATIRCIFHKYFPLAPLGHIFPRFPPFLRFFFLRNAQIPSYQCPSQLDENLRSLFPSLASAVRCSQYGYKNFALFSAVVYV